MRVPAKKIAEPVPVAAIVEALDAVKLVPAPETVKCEVNVGEIDITVSSVGVIAVGGVDEVVVEVAIKLIRGPDVILTARLSGPTIIDVAICDFTTPVAVGVQPLIQAISTGTGLVSSRLDSQ